MAYFFSKKHFKKLRTCIKLKRVIILFSKFSWINVSLLGWKGKLDHTWTIFQGISDFFLLKYFFFTLNDFLLRILKTFLRGVKDRNKLFVLRYCALNDIKQIIIPHNWKFSKKWEFWEKMKIFKKNEIF